MVSSLVLWKGNSEAPSLWFRSGSQWERGHNGNQLHKAPCLELFLLPSLLFPSLSHFYSWGLLPNKLLATKSSSAWTKPGATSLPQHESSPKERASAGKFLNLGMPSLPCHTCVWPLLTRLGPRLPAFFSRCLLLLPGIAMASLTSAFEAPPQNHMSGWITLSQALRASSLWSQVSCMLVQSPGPAGHLEQSVLSRCHILLTANGCLDLLPDPEAKNGIYQVPLNIWAETEGLSVHTEESLRQGTLWREDMHCLSTLSSAPYIILWWNCPKGLI